LATMTKLRGVMAALKKLDYHITQFSTVHLKPSTVRGYEDSDKKLPAVRYVSCRQWSNADGRLTARGGGRGRGKVLDEAGIPFHRS
jgi:hypothetical protein